MTIKEKLLSYRKKLTESELATSGYDLDSKVDGFIYWYAQEILKCNVTNIGEFQKSNELRNFIEKMAVWYELQYPDYDIASEDKSINRITWQDFYKNPIFYNTLTEEEKSFLIEPSYPDIIYPYENSSSHFHLTKDGIIDESEIYLKTIEENNPDDLFEGKHIEEAKIYAKKLGIPFDESEKSEITRYINGYKKRQQFIELLLESVMCRVIERGGNRIGPRRGFLFAKKFGTNIDIPMKYGYDTSDPYMRVFIHAYLKSGGNKDLKCIVNYFHRASNDEPLPLTHISSIMIPSLREAVDNAPKVKYI